jgi:superfamily II DNA or RNA helicase
MKFLPEGFKRYEYQQQAVLNAKKIVEEYGGVFLSDVVGLGKTYIAAMLASQLDGRTFVIAPPALLDKNNPGSWTNVFSDFHISADFESTGKLDAALEAMEKREYRNIIIDEAHRFRTETTIGYEKLAELCRGKRVILVTATPYNNSPLDVLNQIKLFQNARKSTIPNLPNLEQFFNKLNENVKKINKKNDYDAYIQVVKENSKEIREKVLKYLMVRRTRSEIERYFIADVKTQNLHFPAIQDPKPLYYKLNSNEDAVFTETIKLIAQDFTYARYKPLTYYKGKISQPEELSQENMGKFMKVLLVKRLESSFHAFRRSIERFITSYELFIREFDKGNVYISKKYINKIFELLENDDDAAVQELIESGRAECYKSSDFTDAFRSDLQNDLEILKRIQRLWQTIQRDPKLEKLQHELSSNVILKDNKIIIFTESKETAEYLCSNIKDKAICYHGGSGENERDTIIANFDAKARHQKDDYRILISTEVLSEGVNLHRANVVINYDIPWNPTRMMQRVGRINRVDTPFDTIYTFNFFPTTQAEDEIALKKTAEAKINAFLTLLGGDAALLTEGEPVSSHELFNRLISKEVIMGEDEAGDSELKYLTIIQDIRNTNPILFEKIKRLPRKARAGRKIASGPSDALLTYFRYGKLQKFFIAPAGNDARELDFITAAKLFECTKDEPGFHWNTSFYQLLDENKKAFAQATREEELIVPHHGGRDSTTQLAKVLKATLQNTQSLTDEQEQYLNLLLSRLEAGSIPKQTIKNTLNALSRPGAELNNPLKVLAIMQQNISTRLLESHYAEDSGKSFSKREVILSLYLM